MAWQAHDDREEEERSVRIYRYTLVAVHEVGRTKDNAVEGKVRDRSLDGNAEHATMS